MKLWQQPRTRWLLGIPVGGLLMLVLGATGLGVANFAIHETSTTEFCFSCHSHEVNIRAEYEASSHFKNQSGVRTECADCHLPQDNWFKLVATKIIVSADILPELAGKLDTVEKWEAHRGEMAERVWDEYRSNDSAYCRHCHDVAAMIDQSTIVSRMHQQAKQGDKTCIDCHKGLVHQLPEITSR